MGTWEQPDTAEKAGKLAKIVSLPLAQKNATRMLSGIIGDDDLFDRIEDHVSSPSQDVRFLVLNKLREWLKNLDGFVRPWDVAAVNICQNIVDTVDAPSLDLERRKTLFTKGLRNLTRAYGIIINCGPGDVTYLDPSDPAMDMLRAYKICREENSMPNPFTRFP